MDTVLQIINILGALGLFIFGMKVMSDGIQKVAGNKLRSGLASMTNTRLGGVLTGFGTTAIIQSSSATTVMIVSFVNAGLLSLKQAIGVIMGANIGTTITALIIVIFGFKFKITAFALPILAVAVPMILAKKDRIKYLGEFLIGFSVLFIGLGELKDLVPNELDSGTQQFISDLGQYGFFSTVLMVIVGTLLTILVQSSSAAIAITLTLCAKGLIPFEMAAAIVLGENIGTTITANIAAVVGNTAAKRAARAHLIFNIMGVIWMLILFNPFLRLIDFIVVELGLGSPFQEVDSIKDGLTAFHMSFNILNTLALVWFVGFIAKIVTRMVPETGTDQTFRLQYISNAVINTPTAAIEAAKLEMELFAKNVVQMSSKVKEILIGYSGKTKNEIEQLEENSDQYHEEISNYIVQVAASDLDTESSDQIRKVIDINGSLERIADGYIQMSRLAEKAYSAGSKVAQEQGIRLQELTDLVAKALEVASNNLKGPYESVSTFEAKEIESRINDMVLNLRAENTAALQNQQYDIKTGFLYRDMINTLETIGDLLLEITEDITGKYQEEDLV